MFLSEQRRKVQKDRAVSLLGVVYEVDASLVGHTWGRSHATNCLAHRLRLAGTQLPLFEPAAEEAVFQATSGLPRKVNGLAHHALMAAALARASTVTADHIQAALPELA
jgi:type II secretory pathway predicted ATPase ExeA